MDITILGAGGLGASLGGWLARSGNDVTLIFRRQQHVDEIQNRGLIVTGVEEFTVSTRATTDPADIEATDLLIVAVKNKDTETALRAAKDIQPRCVTSMQNGFTKEEWIAGVYGEDKVIGSACFTGGVLEDYGRVSRVNRRSTYFGEMDGKQTDRVQEIVDVFNTAGLNAYITNDVVSLEWTKQAWWVPQALLSAITRLPFVQVYLRPDLARLIVSMTREIAQVANVNGIEIGDYPELGILPLINGSFSDAIKIVQEKGKDFVKQGMGDYQASMLLDVLNARKTELEDTAGYVIKEAKKLQIEIPYLEFAYLAVRGIEEEF